MSRIGIFGFFIVVLTWSLPAPAAEFLVDGVPIPRDAKIAPSRSAPEKFSRFSGAWVGAWGGQQRHILIVENVRADGNASVVYAVGENLARNVRRQWHRHNANISGDTLRVESFAIYEMTASGKLSANYSGGNSRDSAILSKIELADLLHPGATIAWTKPVKPLDTPQQEVGNPPVTSVAIAPPAPATASISPAMAPSAAQSPSVARPQGRRVGLVIGVSNYEHAPPLTNTLNDATDVAAALQRLGFDVEKVTDPSRSALEAAIRRYGDRSIGAQVSVFHFSGHALESGRRNWLLPATANISSERDLRFEAIDLDTILDQTDGATNVSVVFLDACRDNPFTRRLASTGRNLTLTEHGLAGVPMTSTGMLVAFAAAPGQVALDGSKQHSPFTEALLRHIETPSLEIKSLMARVTKDVVEATKGKQRPWQNSSLEGEFYFVPPRGGAAAPVAQGAVNLEVVFWDSIKASHDPADLQAYLTQFPKGVFAELARNRLAMLQRQATAIPPQAAMTPPAPPDKPPAAVQQESTGRPSTPSSSPLHDMLLARFAAVSVAANEAENRTRNYEAEADHKAIAVAAKAHLTWRQSYAQEPLRADRTTRGRPHN